MKKALYYVRWGVDIINTMSGFTLNPCLTQSWKATLGNASIIGRRAIHVSLWPIPRVLIEHIPILPLVVSLPFGENPEGLSFLQSGDFHRDPPATICHP